jgi:hypothetical protein
MIQQDEQDFCVNLSDTAMLIAHLRFEAFVITCTNAEGDDSP